MEHMGRGEILGLFCFSGPREGLRGGRLGGDTYGICKDPLRIPSQSFHRFRRNLSSFTSGPGPDS